MEAFDNRLTIRRPAEDVFGFLADFENVPTWNHAIASTTKASPGPVGVGSRGPNELASQREALALTDSARGRSITDGPAIEWKALLAERSLQPEGVRNSDYPCDLPLRRSWPLVRWARIRPLEGAASDTCPPNRSGCDLSRTDSTLAGNRSACTQAFIPRATGVRARLPEGVRNPDHLHSATESPLLASERAAARNR
jgi:hypothetical protein